MRAAGLLVVLVVAAAPAQPPPEPDLSLPPLHAAVKAGDVAAVRRLLATGADVNEKVTGEPKGQAYATSLHAKGITPLHVAAARASPEMIGVLVKAKADPTAKDVHERTPMYFAAVRGDPKVLRALLDAGVKIDAPADYWVGPPVAVAAFHGNPDAVRWLAEAGADVNAGKRPALFSAVERHDFELAEFLLKRGTALRARIIPNQTPGNHTVLGRAAEADDAEAVAWLLAHGADPLEAADNTGTLPWRKAAERYRVAHPDRPRPPLPVMRTFIEGLTPGQLDASAALHDLVALDLAREAARVIDRGGSPDARDKDGRTPLHVAALERKPAMVELLAKRKADLDPLDRRGLTPLHHAAFEACKRTVTESGMYGHFGGGRPLSTGVGPHPVDYSKGQQPHNADETLRMLLRVGADPERANPKGVTPLHLAAMVEDRPLTLLFTGLDVGNGFAHVAHGGASYWVSYTGVYGPPVVEALLWHGAGLNPKTKGDFTPWDVAATPAVREMLEKADGLTGLDGLPAAVAAGDFAALRKPDPKADLNAPTVGGLTPLTWALFRGRDELVPLLLKAGADANRRDAHRLSPLWLALSLDRPGPLAALLAAGASPDVVTTKEEMPVIGMRLNHYLMPAAERPLAVAVGRFGRSPFHTPTPGPLAASFRGIDLRLLKLLLAYDADPNVVLDDSGWTALHYAAASGHAEAARLLLARKADPAAKDKKGRTPADVLPKDPPAELRELFKR